MISPITFCIGTSNNLNYLKLAIKSVREYSYYKDAPFIIFAENCTDGTDEWLLINKDKYNSKIKNPSFLMGSLHCYVILKIKMWILIHIWFIHLTIF